MAAMSLLASIVLFSGLPLLFGQLVLVNGQPGTFAGDNCQIVLILAATATATQNPTCPLGSLIISLNPTATTASATYYDGVGPCGIPTVVPGNIEKRRC